MQANKFLRTSKNFSGTVSSGNDKTSKMTKARKRALATLISMASQLEQSQLEVATKILQNSREEIAAFVTQNKETPSPYINQLIVQAAIIRLKEIATVSKVLDVSNSASLKEIEEAESEAVEQNQSVYILSPQAGAALLVVMEAIMNKIKGETGISSVKDYVSLLNQYRKADNVVGDSSADDWYNYYTNTSSGTATGGTSSAGASTNTILDWINVIGNQATNIYNSIFGKNTSTGGIAPTSDPIGDLINKIKNIGSDTGSDSINKSLDKYKWYIVGGFVVLLLVIILAVYAGKRK